MVWLRVAYRLTGMVLTQLWAVCLAVALKVLFATSHLKRRKYIVHFTRTWGRWCCYFLNIRIHRTGVTKLPSAALIVSNHIGSPDIFVLAACFETFFVSKADIVRWPVVGPMTRLGDTVFIDRTRRQQVSAMVKGITERLQAGFSVALFPEGRATLGDDIAPFKSSAFEAAVRARVPVLPVAIRYHDGNTPSIACWRVPSFVTHMMDLLRNPVLEVTVTVLPPIAPDADRRVLARQSRDAIRNQYLSENAHNPEQ